MQVNIREQQLICNAHTRRQFLVESSRYSTSVGTNLCLAMPSPSGIVVFALAF